MKKCKSHELLDELQSDVRQFIAAATLLKIEDPGDLLQEPSPGKWSVVQVLEHLNSYGRYYLLAMEKSMEQQKPARENYTPGWLGDYFTKLMRPAAGGVLRNKMQAPKNHRPAQFLDAFPVLNTFIEQQHYLLNLLEKAKEKNIGGIRVPISLTRLLKLKLGDTFRFLLAHQERHFVQITNALQQVKRDRNGIHSMRHQAKTRRAV